MYYRQIITKILHIRLLFIVLILSLLLDSPRLIISVVLGKMALRREENCALLGYYAASRFLTFEGETDSCLNFGQELPLLAA
jgi:hypothetical protein